MDTETSTLAFRTALSEIKNTCPDISNIFILNDNNQVITQDQNTSKELIDCAAESLAALMKTATIAGGIESWTCSGATQKINCTRYENNYFVTVASDETDEKALSTIARVMVPSMLRLAQEVMISRKDSIPAIAKNKASAARAQTIATAPSSFLSRAKPAIVEVPAAEFVVDNLSGLNIISGDPDTINVDRALIGTWKEIYGDKNIEKATVENAGTGKRIRCKFQPIKNEKLDGQNVVLIPRRIQGKLEIKKGSMVRIRPVIEEGEKKHE